VNLQLTNDRFCGNLNSILAKRTCFVGKTFFKMLVTHPRALRLHFVHPESHDDRKQRQSNLSIKLIPAHSIRLFYRQSNERTSHTSTAGLSETHPRQWMRLPMPIQCKYKICFIEGFWRYFTRT